MAFQEGRAGDCSPLGLVSITVRPDPDISVDLIFFEADIGQLETWPDPFGCLVALTKRGIEPARIIIGGYYRNAGKNINNQLDRWS